MKQVPIERRRCPRHTLKIRIRLRNLSSIEPEMWCQSVNLSVGGVLIETDSALVVGSRVDVTLTLLEEVTSQPTTEWHCTGHVAHATCQRGNEESRIGVQFDRLNLTQSASGSADIQR